MSLFILFFLLSVFLSFFCSVLEAVLLSISDSFIEVALHEQKSYAKRLKNLRLNIDRPLSAILTLNTFANTLGAAGVGAQAQLIWGDNAITLVSAMLTLIILYFSEITPKVLGARYFKELIPIAVPILRVLLIAMYPFVTVSKVITRAFRPKEEKSFLSRTNLVAFVEAGKNQGILKEDEKNVLQNILKLNSIPVKMIMTPRTVLHAVQEDISVNQYIDAQNKFTFRRILLFSESADEISGYALKDDILLSKIEGKGEVLLSALKREIYVVLENARVTDLFNHLIENNEQIALVLDEYGITAGIVTIEDLIETMVGKEIMDETDSIEDMQLLAKMRWKDKTS